MSTTAMNFPSFFTLMNLLALLLTRFSRVHYCSKQMLGALTQELNNYSPKRLEYATAGMDNQLFVSKYLLQLPSKETLEHFIQHQIATWK